MANERMSQENVGLGGVFFFRLPTSQCGCAMLLSVPCISSLSRYTITHPAYDRFFAASLNFRRENLEFAVRTHHPERELIYSACDHINRHAKSWFVVLTFGTKNLMLFDRKEYCEMFGARQSAAICAFVPQTSL